MKIKIIFALAITVFSSAILYNCSQSNNLGSDDAAKKVYVAPGDKDEFYAFMSGGFSGHVSVYGLPSGRLFKVINVFAQSPETGYGYSEESKGMLQTSLGFIPWDDAHHPELSQTDGVPDGRWLFSHPLKTQISFWE